MHADPIAVFEAAVAALQREDWMTAAGLCDPVSLLHVRESTLGLVASDEAPPEVTLEEVREFLPNAPWGVLQYVANEETERANARSELERHLHGVGSLEALHRMSPQEVFAASLARTANPLPRRKEDDADGVRVDAILFPQDVIGVVMQGDRVARVVYRTVWPEDTRETPGQPDWFDELAPEEQERARLQAFGTQPQVSTLLRQPDGSWRIVADQLPHLVTRILGPGEETGPDPGR